MRGGIATFALGVTILGSGAAGQESPPPALEFAFAETVTLGKVVEVGKTVRGERRIIPITGGHFEGPRIKGEVMPGGWDWQLTRADGCTDVKADYFLKTDGLEVQRRAVAHAVANHLQAADDDLGEGARGHGAPSGASPGDWQGNAA